MIVTFGMMVFLHYRKCLSRARSQRGMDGCQILPLQHCFILYNYSMVELRIISLF